MSLNKITALIVFFLITTTAKAQYTEVINSNRPGVSKSAFAVGTNVMQLEVGPYYIEEEHDLLNYTVAGYGADFAARFGLIFSQLEINIEGIYQNDTFSVPASNYETDRANFKHLTVGAKYLVYDPYKNADDKPNLYSYHANRKFKWKSLIPAVAVYAGANFDAKDNPYTANGVEGFSPKVMIATQNNFANGWVLVLNFIKDRIGSTQSDFQYVATLTKSITTKWVLFGETQGIHSDFYADNLFRFGGAYLWSKNFQLDTAVTFNTKNTPTVLGLNLGASYRFDFHKDKKIDNGNSAEEELERKVNRSKKGKKDKDKSSKKANKHEKEMQDIDFNED